MSNELFLGVDNSTNGPSQWAKPRCFYINASGKFVNPGLSNVIVPGPNNFNAMFCLDYFQITLSGNAFVAAAGTVDMSLNGIGAAELFYVGSLYLPAAAPAAPLPLAFNSGFISFNPGFISNYVVNDGIELVLTAAITGNITWSVGYHYEHA